MGEYSVEEKVCNTGLGLFHDDPIRLRAALAYIDPTNAVDGDTWVNTA